MRARAVVSVGVNPYNNPQGLLPMQGGEEITILSVYNDDKVLAKNDKGQYGFVIKSYYKPLNKISNLKVSKKPPEIINKPYERIKTFEDDYYNGDMNDFDVGLLESQQEGYTTPRQLSFDKNTNKKPKLMDPLPQDDLFNDQYKGVTMMGYDSELPKNTKLPLNIKSNKMNHDKMNNNDNNNDLEDNLKPNIPQSWLTPNIDSDVKLGKKSDNSRNGRNYDKNNSNHDNLNDISNLKPQIPESWLTPNIDIKNVNKKSEINSSEKSNHDHNNKDEDDTKKILDVVTNLSSSSSGSNEIEDNEEENVLNNEGITLMGMSISPKD